MTFMTFMTFMTLMTLVTLVTLMTSFYLGPRARHVPAPVSTEMPQKAHKQDAAAFHINAGRVLYIHGSHFI